jgi:hypothetical protein
MGLNAEVLKNQLIDAVFEKDTAQSAHNAIASAINSYMNENLKAYGTYSGIIAGTPPISDPLAGNYVFSFSGCNIDGNALMSAASVSVEAWLNCISSFINLMVSDASDEAGILSLTPLLVPPPLMSTNFASAENYVQSMEILANTIVSAFDEKLPIGGTPCASTSGGTGAWVPGGFE